MMVIGTVIAEGSIVAVCGFEQVVTPPLKAGLITRLLFEWGQRVIKYISCYIEVRITTPVIRKMDNGG